MLTLAPLLLLVASRPPSEPPPAWLTTFPLGGAPLSVRIWRLHDAPTEIEVLWGSKILARREDDLYFDRSVRPRLWTRGKEAVLVFAAGPGAGSGQYASVWRIGNGGRRLVPIGVLRNADLRRWPLAREIRPAKYATDDMLRVFPNMYHEEPYAHSFFVVAYRYDRKAKRLRLVGVRLATKAESDAWPYAVRFPRG